MRPGCWRCCTCIWGGARERRDPSQQGGRRRSTLASSEAWDCGPPPSPRPLSSLLVIHESDQRSGAVRGLDGAVADQLAFVEQAFLHPAARAPDREPVFVLGFSLEQRIGGDADDAVLSAQVFPVVVERRLDAEQPVAAPAGFAHVDERAVARWEFVTARAAVGARMPPAYRVPDGLFRAVVSEVFA
jgi:hypothetical protein